MSDSREDTEYVEWNASCKIRVTADPMPPDDQACHSAIYVNDIESIYVIETVDRWNNTFLQYRIVYPRCTPPTINGISLYYTVVNGMVDPKSNIGEIDGAIRELRTKPGLEFPSLIPTSMK